MLGSMASGYKHFSHTHNLVMHEMPDGAEVSCSGCNSSAANTVYVCWQCGFYLHEQCFQATRSRNHPSHPLHPLTLVPYPTYPSNSFYCNSCKVIGTGFSYSCSDCDFDLHVQCAYSISSATNFHQPHPVTSPPPHTVSYPNQEVVPILPNAPSISFPTPIPVPTPIPIPTPVPVHARFPINNTQDSYMAPNSLPTSAHNMYVSQNSSNFPTSAQISSIPQTTASVFVPTSAAPNSYSPTYGESTQTRMKDQGIKHFSHPHGLVLVNVKHGKKKIACSGCQETLVGKGYACVEENCGFQIDESCFNLEKEIQHKSHPAHPLTLHSSSPYSKEKGTPTCNGCFKDCTGFIYHCSICEYDLHVKCANLKEMVKRDDHEHGLKLQYKCPLKGEEYTFFCDVCDRVVPRDHWTYYCKECDYGTHLDCVHREECDGTDGDHVVDAAVMQMLGKTMDAARINAFSAAAGLKY